MVMPEKCTLVAWPAHCGSPWQHEQFHGWIAGIWIQAVDELLDLHAVPEPIIHSLGSGWV